MAAKRGRAASIVAADTDVVITAEVTSKEFKITRMLLSNNGPVAVRVRLWDVFTDTSGDVHSSTVNPILIEDRNLLSDETVELLEADGLVTVAGGVTAQSTVGAAFPDDVIVGVWGEFE